MLFKKSNLIFFILLISLSPEVLSKIPIVFKNYTAQGSNGYKLVISPKKGQCGEVEPKTITIRPFLANHDSDTIPDSDVLYVTETDPCAFDFQATDLDKEGSQPVTIEDAIYFKTKSAKQHECSMASGKISWSYCEWDGKQHIITITNLNL